jgi:hypothetical protein
VHGVNFLEDSFTWLLRGSFWNLWLYRFIVLWGNQLRFESAFIAVLLEFNFIDWFLFVWYSRLAQLLNPLELRRRRAKSFTLIYIEYMKKNKALHMEWLTWGLKEHSLVYSFITLSFSYSTFYCLLWYECDKSFKYSRCDFLSSPLSYAIAIDFVSKAGLKLGSPIELLF